MNDFPKHNRHNVNHRLNRAARLRRESNLTLNAAEEMAAEIAANEPVLSSRHSEVRDRRYKRRIHTTLTRAILEPTPALSLPAGDDFSLHGIRNSDPDALPKLRIVLEHLSLARHRMKAANVCIRNNDRAGLRAMLFSDPEIDQLMQPDFTGHRGYSPRLLTSIKADIRSAADRIRDLENERYRPDPTRLAPAATQRSTATDDVAA